MNSYATAVGNMQLVAQEYERRCREFELRARNARIQAERDAARPSTAVAPARRGPVAAILAAFACVAARVAGRHALAR